MKTYGAYTVPAQSSVEMKVVFLGRKGCGKTTLFNRLSGQNKPPPLPPTIGVDVLPLSINNKFIWIWDPAGYDSKFVGIKAGYYAGADLFIVFGDQNAYETEVEEETRKNASVLYVTGVDDAVTKINNYFQ